MDANSNMKAVKIKCSKCGTLYPLNKLRFKWVNGISVGTCLICVHKKSATQGLTVNIPIESKMIP